MVRNIHPHNYVGGLRIRPMSKVKVIIRGQRSNVCCLNNVRANFTSFCCIYTILVRNIRSYNYVGGLGIRPMSKVKVIIRGQRSKFCSLNHIQANITSFCCIYMILVRNVRPFNYVGGLCIRPMSKVKVTNWGKYLYFIPCLGNNITRYIFIVLGKMFTQMKKL